MEGREMGEREGKGNGRGKRGGKREGKDPHCFFDKSNPEFKPAQLTIGRTIV